MLSALVVSPACGHRLMTKVDVSTWFPSHVGDAWLYQNEFQDSSTHIEHWRTEETVVSSTAIAEGALLLKRVKVLDPLPEDVSYLRDRDDWQRSHYLIHDDCLYVLDGPDAIEWWTEALDSDNQLGSAFRDDLLHGHIAPTFCFPLDDGKVWSKVPDTGPLGEDTWKVTGFNRADPDSPDRGPTFHLSSTLGGGFTTDRWFERGVGVVREKERTGGLLPGGWGFETRRKLLRFEKAH
jgi:hypothetical protein